MDTAPTAFTDLYDPARHEALTRTPWSERAARAAIDRIAQAAEAEFDEAEGGWLMHPQDEPPAPGTRSCSLYHGATGVAWALRDLAAQGAVALRRDYAPWIAQFPERMRAEAAEEMHGSASYLLGESGPLLLAWRATGRAEFADRLFDLVQGNLHNTANEPLWGNAGTMLAAVHMAEATAGAPEAGRWRSLLADAVAALLQDMAPDPDEGLWTWRQDLYGSRTHYLGAGHGLAGNVYGALRAATVIADEAIDTIVRRGVDTVVATALHATRAAPEGEVPVANWHALTDRELIRAYLAKGRRPYVQDCHGAPGIVVRMAGAAGLPDALLRAAGEMTWHAGPLAKGPSLCHGTAGSALACLKLWRRLAEPLWLARARHLAMHAAEQVERARAEHGQGRHSLWTGDLGVACVLWACVLGDDAFPTLDRGPR